ncbi:MAG: desulfoferrodoxin [Treponema sp.]|jgi:superoxide reductase|nr:desulfoferrodoxin [Treponema sp.]
MEARILDIYKCEGCGLIVEVLQAGGCEPMCCGKPMQRIKENTVDAAREKHVPIIEKKDGGYKVTVGAVIHPMEEKHYIQWIELSADGVSYRKFLKPGSAPEAFFAVDAQDVSAREYCNLHGLWSRKC